MNFSEKWIHAQNGGHKQTFIGHVNSKSTNHPFRYIISDAMEIIPNQHYDKILDIGCGDGWGANYLKERFTAKEAHGITISETEKQWAQDSYPDIQVKVMDAHDLQYPDAYFDLIVSRDSFEHLLSPFLALNEMWRVSKLGALLMIAVPLGFWRTWDEHLLVPDQEQMTHLLKLSGFELLKYEEFEYPPDIALTQGKYLARKV